MVATAAERHLRLVGAGDVPARTDGEKGPADGPDDANDEERKAKELAWLMPASIKPVNGSDQNVAFGAQPEPLIARVRNWYDDGCEGVKTVFRVAKGDVTIVYADETTGPKGEAVCEFTAGPGPYRIEFMVTGANGLPLSHAFKGVVDEAPADGPTEASAAIAQGTPDNDVPAAEEPPVPAAATPVAVQAPEPVIADAIPAARAEQAANAAPPAPEPASPRHRPTVESAKNAGPARPAAGVPVRPAPPKFAKLMLGRKGALLIGIIAMLLLGTVGALAAQLMSSPAPKPAIIDCTGAQTRVENGKVVSRGCVWR